MGAGSGVGERIGTSCFSTVPTVLTGLAAAAAASSSSSPSPSTSPSSLLAWLSLEPKNE